MNKNSKNEDSLKIFFKSIDRSFFIDNEYKEYARYDKPLPIGFGQTISQPSLVYEMTSRLELKKYMSVLEIGTGSGFQTVLLAEFAGEVYTIERINEFSEKARKRLDNLGYKNIHYKIGDGCEGWSEFAPYDRIIVTAGAGKLPEPLIGQLKNGGRMIIPVGERESQDLILVLKEIDGNIKRQFLCKVIFVELKGKYG